MSVQIIKGNSRIVLPTLGSNALDACVTDPPYELTSARPGGRSEATRGKLLPGFMGMKWDGTGIAFDPEFWVKVLDTLKPGAHLVAFGGTRTYHRIIGIELDEEYIEIAKRRSGSGLQVSLI